MKEYMELLTESLAPRVTTSGCKYELWGGGDFIFGVLVSGINKLRQVICALYQTCWGLGLTLEGVE